jgi:hypothetical protein
MLMSRAIDVSNGPEARARASACNCGKPLAIRAAQSPPCGMHEPRHDAGIFGNLRVSGISSR